MTAAKRPQGRAVRKRYPSERARWKRTRPSTPAPKDGWLIGDLARLTGVPLRALRYYVSKGLLRPIEFRGTATRYRRRELLRLLKAIELKAASRTRVVLSDLKRELDALSDAQLESWAATQLLSTELAAALGISARPPLPAAPSGAGQAAFGAASADTWHRVQLLPGLELMLSSSASPAVQSIARRLYAECVGTGPT